MSKSHNIGENPFEQSLQHSPISSGRVDWIRKEKRRLREAEEAIRKACLDVVQPVELGGDNHNSDIDDYDDLHRLDLDRTD